MLDFSFGIYYICVISCNTAKSRILELNFKGSCSIREVAVVVHFEPFFLLDFEFQDLKLPLHSSPIVSVSAACLFGSFLVFTEGIRIGFLGFGI